MTDSTPKKAAQSLQVPMKKGDTEASAMARCMASPTSNATVTLHNFHPLTGVAGAPTDINAIRAELSKQVLEVRAGEMARPEAMLVAQAHSLDAIFNALAQKAAANIAAGYGVAGESYLRMALKAQSQCRTTIEAISEIKNPNGPTFIKQQNVAQNQQVNNGVPADSRTSTPARTHEKDITPSNELLEASHGERLDIGTAGPAIGANPELATVGAVDRTKNKGRQRRGGT